MGGQTGGWGGGRELGEPCHRVSPAAARRDRLAANRRWPAPTSRRPGGSRPAGGSEGSSSTPGPWWGGGAQEPRGQCGGSAAGSPPSPRGPMALVWDPSSRHSQLVAPCGDVPKSHVLSGGQARRLSRMTQGSDVRGQLCLPPARSLAGGGGPHAAEAKSLLCSRLGTSPGLRGTGTAADPPRALLMGPKGTTGCSASSAPGLLRSWQGEASSL